MKVSIIIPTYNRAKKLNMLLKSLMESNFKDFEVIVNDDKRTNDDTKTLIGKFKKDGLSIQYLNKNIRMAQARREASKYAKGDILVHLDSDMRTSKGLIGEIVELMKTFDALIIPERELSKNFWGKCKQLEKKIYQGNENIESIRAIKKNAYFKLGGHDVRMVYFEDKDLDLRARKAGYKIGRTKNYIYHDEGSPKLFELLLKKSNRSNTVYIFAQKHPESFKWQRNIFNRYLIFIKNIKYLFIDPTHFIGLLFLKHMEYLTSGIGYLLNTSKKSRVGIYIL